MPDFFAEEIVEQTAVLSKEDSHHALRVLRIKPGELIRVSVNNHRYEASLEVRDDTVVARILQEVRSSEAKTRITLYQGWPKGDKMDQIVRQATELGAYAIVPCIFSRCVARPEQAHKRIERLNKITREAAMQSGRTLIPVVEGLLDFDTLCERLQQHGQALVPYELAGEMSLRTVHQDVRDIAIVIGPEGGFTADEIKQLPAVPVTLGPRILRTETAGIAAIAMLLALADDYK
ncbi:MAG: 16S rRNA (uracil(1498)-N(3))-methyltransferase [Clostridiales bacterium]|nr:16S rRNA (uracil(1498)-N(3))-methyltransferase [Clostridiales bacterium]